MSQSLDRIGQDLVNQLQEGIKTKGLVASGRLLNSIQYKVVNGTVEIYAYDYIYTLVKGGRKPNSKGVGGFFSEMLQWVSAKPSVVPSDMTPSQFAAATMVKISKEGNSMFRKGFSGKNDGELLNQLDFSGLDNIAEDLIVEMMKNINLE